MKKFTKGLMTLALLVLGLSNVYAGEETSISERDWTTTTEYPYYWMGDEEKPNFCKGTATVQIVDGALQISNTVD